MKAPCAPRKSKTQQNTSLEPVEEVPGPQLEPNESAEGTQQEFGEAPRAARGMLKETLVVKLKIGVPAAENYAADHPTTWAQPSDNNQAIHDVVDADADAGTEVRASNANNSATALRKPLQRLGVQLDRHPKLGVERRRSRLLRKTCMTSILQSKLLKIQSTTRL
jgi:hypothetical protein